MRARDAWRGQGMLLAIACVLMLAVGLAASTATPAAPVAIEWDEVVGEGTYMIPFRDRDGTEKALVFTVPGGMHIEFAGMGIGGCATAELCTRLPAFFSVGELVGFCLDVATAEECGRAYGINRVWGEPVDDYGAPSAAGALMAVTPTTHAPRGMAR